MNGGLNNYEATKMIVVIKIAAIQDKSTQTNKKSSVIIKCLFSCLQDFWSCCEAENVEGKKHELPPRVEKEFV